MRLVYNGKNVFTCHMPDGESVRLVHGFNEIADDDQAREFLRNPVVQKKIQRGLITPFRTAKPSPADFDLPRDPVQAQQEPSPAPAQSETDQNAAGEAAPGADAPVDGTAPVQRRPVAEVLAEIAVTYDHGRLKALSEDKRKQVADAAANRLKELNDVPAASGAPDAAGT